MDHWPHDEDEWATHVASTCRPDGADTCQREAQQKGPLRAVLTAMSSLKILSHKISVEGGVKILLSRRPNLLSPSATPRAIDNTFSPPYIFYYLTPPTNNI